MDGRLAVSLARVGLDDAGDDVTLDELALLARRLAQGVSGEPVDTADRVKGYQVSKGQYVMVEDSEIEALKIESTKTIEIETFVPHAEIDPYFGPGGPL